MSLKLYGVKDSARIQRALITAQYVGAKIECPKFHPGKDDQTKEFLLKSPLGRTPVLECPKGCLVGSNTIVRYLGRQRMDTGLYGDDFFERAEVDMWIEMCQNELEVPLAAWVYPALGLCPPNEEASKRAQVDVKKILEFVDAHLKSKTFLVSEHVTIADITLSMTLADAYKAVFTKDYVKDFPNVNRWLQTCYGQPQFKAVLGDMKMGSAKQVKPAGDKPAEGDASPAPAKKPVNPLDELPPSSMNLDEWKRCYSNTKDLRGEAMTWFWKNFDPSGWSFYWMRYDKLEGECEVSYVTSNLLHGFIQRIDNSFRKYSFGVIDVVGNEGDLNIQGVWMFRGKEIPFEMKDHPSFEYHTFRKLDHNNADDKKLIEDYWCSDEEVSGLPIQDGKVWK